MTRSNLNRPQVFGTGLIALDVVISAEPNLPIRAWAGGTCGNVLSILAVLGWDAYPIARMNGDAASRRVRADMKKWGVQLEFSACSPTTDTPIIIQRISRTDSGAPKHRFSWGCPRCGSWLPSFKPVTTNAVQHVSEHMGTARAFFMDRLSRSSLLLAKRAADSGAVVVFEPSAKSSEKLLGEAMKIAHIVKYSDERFTRLPGAMDPDNATLVEVQTVGANGLRYRHRLGRSVSAWKQLGAIRATTLADTCGSGDWCTAGLISMAARRGLDGLTKGGAKGLVKALRFGQKLAAWNVGFEGARGAMYAVEPPELQEHLRVLKSGQPQMVQPAAKPRRINATIVACPACKRSTVRSQARAANARLTKQYSVRGARHP